MNFFLKENDIVLDLVTNKESKIVSILKHEGIIVGYIIDVDYPHNDRFPWELKLLGNSE